MARLFSGEKQAKSTQILRLLQGYSFGLREAEVADILGWERRTANNYLRELETQERVYKEGRLWYAEE
jgi:DNA-binding IclR family transcriptional regulator